MLRRKNCEYGIYFVKTEYGIFSGSPVIWRKFTGDLFSSVFSLPVFACGLYLPSVTMAFKFLFMVCFPEGKRFRKWTGSTTFYRSKKCMAKTFTTRTPVPFRKASCGCQNAEAFLKCHFGTLPHVVSSFPDVLMLTAVIKSVLKEFIEIHISLCMRYGYCSNNRRCNPRGGNILPGFPLDGYQRYPGIYHDLASMQ